MTKHNCKSTCPCQQHPDVQMPSDYIDTKGKEFAHIKHYTRPDRLDAGHNFDDEDKSEAAIKHCSLGILGAIVEPEAALMNKDVKKCVDDLLDN